MNEKKRLKKITYSKMVVCIYCKHEPSPEQLGKSCPRCGGRYEVVDKVQERQPFAHDNRQTGGI